MSIILLTQIRNNIFALISSGAWKNRKTMTVWVRKTVKDGKGS